MILLKRTYRIVRDTYLTFEDDDGFAMAGYIAFSGFLAIFPLLIFLVTLTGSVLGQDQSIEIMNALFEFAPDHIAQTLAPVLQEVLVDRGQGLLTVSFFGTIWLSSNAFEAFCKAFGRAYKTVETRGFFTRRIISIGFVFIGAIVAVVLGFGVIVLPLLFKELQTWFEVVLPDYTAALTFLLGLLVFTLFLMLMHSVLPGRGMRKIRIWPGVIVSVVLWLAIAFLFSVYLSFTPTYTVTYGTLSGVMVTLMFFYLSGVAIIMGAELNAVVARLNAT